MNPVNKDLKSVTFVNSQIGFASGDSGVIIKTTNGGTNWFQLSSGSTDDLIKITFTSINTGYVIGTDSLIMKTTNSGLSWVRQNSNTNNSLTSSSFINDATGFISGLNQTLLKTTNGGSNWNNLTFPESLNFYSIFFINNLTGWLSSEDPNLVGDSALSIFKTTSGGINWFKQYKHNREFSPMLQLQFADSLNGWSVIYLKAVDLSYLIRTTDGGNIWTEYPLGNSGNWCLFFINQEKGWAAGPQNRIRRTTNGGESWINSIALPASINYFSNYFADSLVGWTVGANGIILKTTTGGVLTGFSNTTSEIPDNYSLSQNYPNPFNPNTIINYKCSMFNYISLKVYDILGNEVATLINENIPAGSYDVQFNGADYPSGIYFYSFIIDGNVANTKRMVLLK
ncbi:MAG: YCF48-related protein [Ignavibacteria bacterium]|nr:T9SS type A sorting domain-containing protein [Ignavibacteriota bacterium]